MDEFKGPSPMDETCNYFTTALNHADDIGRHWEFLDDVFTEIGVDPSRLSSAISRALNNRD